MKRKINTIGLTVLLILATITGSISGGLLVAEPYTIQGIRNEIKTFMGHDIDVRDSEQYEPLIHQYMAALELHLQLQEKMEYYKDGLKGEAGQKVASWEELLALSHTEEEDGNCKAYRDYYVGMLQSLLDFGRTVIAGQEDYENGYWPEFQEPIEELDQVIVTRAEGPHYQPSIEEKIEIKGVWGEKSVTAQNAYEKWIFQQYPHYARGYVLQKLAGAYGKSSQELASAGEEQVYFSDLFEKLYHKVNKGKKKEDTDSDGREDFAVLLKEEGEKQIASSKKQGEDPGKAGLAPVSQETAIGYVRTIQELDLLLEEKLENSSFYYCVFDKDLRVLQTNRKDGQDWLKENLAKEKTEGTAGEQGEYFYYDMSYGRKGGGLLKHGMDGADYAWNRQHVDDYLQDRIEQLLKKAYPHQSLGLLVGMDRKQGTEEDDFHVLEEHFRKQQRAILIELILLLLSGAAALLSMIDLILQICRKGRKNKEDPGIWRLCGEVWLILLWVSIVFIADVIDNLGMAGGSELIASGLLSLLAFLCLYILLKQWLAGILLSNSLFCGLGRGCRHWIAKKKGQRMQWMEWMNQLSARKRYRTLILLCIISLFLVLLGAWMAIWVVAMNPEDYNILLFTLGIFALITIASGIFYKKLLQDSMQNALADEKILCGARLLAQGEMGHPLADMDQEPVAQEKKELACLLNEIGIGLEKAVDTAVKSERMKVELITNVSHDIKTPLTSIINYVDLLKRAYEGEEEAQGERIAEYLEVLESKSQRLRILIEDLVEASKASSGAVDLVMARLDLNELVLQTNGEFQEQFSQNQLELISELSQEAVLLYGDGRYLYRILENIYSNAVKYSLPGTRVYLRLWQEEGKTLLTLKNISREQLNITAQELKERFVRGDEARSTEGSGLGLSIASDLASLMGGSLTVEIDGDLFCVRLEFQEEER